MDALQALPVLEKSSLMFDVVYIDPPFSNDLYKECLIAISRSHLLKISSLVVVEHNKKNNLEKLYGKLSLADRREEGDTSLSFYDLKNV